MQDHWKEFFIAAIASGLDPATAEARADACCEILDARNGASLDDAIAKRLERFERFAVNVLRAWDEIPSDYEFHGFSKTITTALLEDGMIRKEGKRLVMSAEAVGLLARHPSTQQIAQGLANGLPPRREMGRKVVERRVERLAARASSDIASNGRQSITECRSDGPLGCGNRSCRHCFG